MNKFLFHSLLFSLLLTLFSCQHDVEGPPGSGSGGAGGGGGTGTGGGGTGGGGTGGGGTGGGGTGGGGTGGGTTCDSTKIYFQQQVLPILLSNCAMSGCHDDASHEDGVILTTYEKVMNTGDVRPGRPNDSELYEVLIEDDPDDRMPRPPRPRLPANQISIIRKWIEQGALNLSCVSSTCDTTNFTYAAIIKPIITNKCQGCHIGTTASAGIDLSTYNGLKAKVTDGRLWGSINHFTGYSPMPKNAAKLSDCEITLISKWINAGALNN
jgi:hypothetical protein